MAAENNRVILITIPFGMSARDILRNAIYRILKERCRIVILSRLSNSADFIKEFAAPNVVFYDLPPISGWRSILRSRILTQWLFYYGKKTGSENLRRHREWLKIKNRRSYRQLSFIIWLLSMLKLWKSVNSITGRLIFQSTYYSEILKKESPDLVMTTSPLVTEEDLLIMYLAKKGGMPTVGSVHSWDNIAKESNPWVLPDKLIVWNHIMKEQAINFLGFQESDVFIAGVPQYDEYLFNTSILSKSEYRALKGIRQNPKILTYTCGNPGYFTDEEDFIKDLIALIEQKVFGNAVLILRLHPKYNAERYKQLFGHYSRVFFDEGDESFNASYLARWPKGNSNASYVNLIYHSDVIINLASTVTIDSAIFNKPVVNVAYDLKPDKGFWFSNAIYYESTHYKHIVASEGARIAYSREELIRYIKMYLEDSSIDREGRKRIVEEQCYKVDGKTGERVVSFILEVAGGRESGRV